MTLEIHNPDSQCITCCELNRANNELINEIHSTLMPLLAKANDALSSFDKEKIDGLMSSPIFKMLSKFGG